MTPVLEFNCRPGGRLPSLTVHVVGPEPAKLCSVCWYWPPGVAVASADVVIVSGSAKRGCVMPCAASCVLTECATTAGVTAAAALNETPSNRLGSVTRIVTSALSPGARLIVGFWIDGF